ncbi:restriction endonuclease subunit S [Flavobacterium crassostreae]|uniref:Type I restriction modification DNA specificity domain-containing protein n=1 Tax=Flavobacterium crassostreae TaxID=1763534 RepID=A0A1B9E8Y8_9FLAO|nr:restriction endonuclease subunit S [Flavobacterium crassostreae]OCB78414.1 hypothetical protein LPBF_02495 [Flavobacterium crassostreae]
MSKVKLIELKNLPIQLIDGDRGINYPSKSEFTNNGYCVFLNTGNVTKNGFDFSNIEYISAERDLLLRKGKLKYNDIVLTTRGTIGNVGYYNDKLQYKHIRINSGMIIMRCDENQINPYYLYLFLRSEIFKKQVLSQGSGSAQPQLPIGSLKNISFPFANVLTQQKIAKVLSDLDAKTEVNNRINSELEAMAKTLYDYWFVQFDFPDVNGTPYKSSGGKMVWNAALKREIPEGWEDGVLSDIANITMGQSPPGESYNEEGNGMIFYQGCTDFGNRFPTIRKYTTSPTRFAKQGDILLSVRAPVGTLNISKEDCCIGRGLACMNSKNDAITYLFGVMVNLKQTFDRRNASGTTFGSITKDDLFSLPVVIPNAKTVRAFQNLVFPSFEKQNKIELENQELASIRDWLLPMLMNGQVSVRDVAEQLGMVAEDSASYGK